MWPQHWQKELLNWPLYHQSSWQTSEIWQRPTQMTETHWIAIWVRFLHGRCAGVWGQHQSLTARPGRSDMLSCGAWTWGEEDWLAFSRQGCTTSISTVLLIHILDRIQTAVEVKGNFFSQPVASLAIFKARSRWNLLMCLSSSLEDIRMLPGASMSLYHEKLFFWIKQFKCHVRRSLNCLRTIV